MYSCFAFPCLASSYPAGSTKGSTLVRSPDLILIRVLPPDLILIRVLPPDSFPQDRLCDLHERPTAGDRWEPLGSDGMWTKRGPNHEHQPAGPRCPCRHALPWAACLGRLTKALRVDRVPLAECVV